MMTETANIGQFLAASGEVKTSKKNYSKFMAESEWVNVRGELYWIYRGYPCEGAVKYRTLAPGVVYVWVDGWKEQIKKVEDYWKNAIAKQS